MDLNPVILSIPIYFLLIGIELVVQQFSKKQYYRLDDAITNISCGVTQQLTGIFFKVFSIGAYVLLYEYFAIWTIPTTWYSLLILFIAADFCYYWAHRMSHEINLFWGGHVVHHQSEDYNFSVALRQSAFQVIWTFAFYLPLAIIGFHPIDFVLMAALVTVYQFWIHTETIGKLGPLEWIFNTPSHHRVHHGRDPKYIDKNHAGVFIIWDKMFGTFQVEEEKPTYGITKPVNSWNPVWVNVEPYLSMAEQLKTIPKWQDKIKFLFYKPGWLPEEMGGYQAAPAVDKKTYTKYEAPGFPPARFYILLQYGLALLFTAFFLFNQDKFAAGEQLVFTGLVVWSVMNCGGLFEMKGWAFQSEWIKWFCIALVAGWLFSISYISLPVMGIFLAFGLFSMAWSFKIYKDGIPSSSGSA